MTKPQEKAAYEFTRNLDSQARNPEAGQGFASAWFNGQVVSATITKAGSTQWKVGVRGKVCSYDNLISYLIELEEARLAEEAKGIQVRMVPDVNYVPGHVPTVSLKGYVDLHLKGTYHYFGVGAVPHGHKARQVFQGPEVDGPWAYAFELATVISDSKASQDRDAAKRAASIDVEDGTILRIDNVSYRVTVSRGERITLVKV